MAISETDVADLHAETFDEEEPSSADLLQEELDEEAVDEEDLGADALLNEGEGPEALELLEEEAEDLEAGEPEAGELEASLDEILAGRLAGDELEAEARTVAPRTEDEELAQVATRQPDEFVCRGCFLLKRRELLADAEHQLCRDCAA